MKAIILNAGLGSRLLPVTKKIPKCMIMVKGKSILEHQIDNLRESGIESILIVVGYLKEKILQLKDPNLIFIENPIYDKTNSSYSLWLAREHLRGHSFVYLNGDLYFHKDILKHLLAARSPNSIVVQQTRNGRDDSFKAVMQGNRIVNMKKQEAGSNACIEVPGPAKLSGEGSAKLFQALDDNMKAGNPTKWVYTMMSQIATDIGLEGVFVEGLPWVEIDDIDDLRRAATLFKDRA
ncbi:MAG: NTP transferase domain-containing protein [Syntrophobacteraceae bacterium]